MGKVSLAARLADEIGTTTDEALRFVDEVGAPKVEETIENAASEGSRIVGDWWKPATIGGGVVGGGALYWREQDLERARQIANQQQDYTNALQAIMESDMAPKRKQEMLRQLNKNTPASDGGGDEDSGGDGLFGGGLEGTLLKGLVVMMVVGFLLNYASSSLPSVDVSAGGAA